MNDRETLDIRRKEQEVLARNLEKWSAEVGLAERLLLEINAGEAALTGHKEGEDVNHARLLLLAGHFNSLHCALYLLLEGYSVQAFALMRVALEYSVAAQYLKLAPEKAAAFLHIPDSVFDRPPGSPTFAAMLAKIGESSEKHCTWIYDFLCTFTHPRPYGLSTARTRTNGQVLIHVGPQTSDRETSIGLLFWFEIAQKALNVIIDLHSAVATQQVDEWSQRYLSLHEEEIAPAIRSLDAAALTELERAQRRAGLESQGLDLEPLRD